MSWLVYALLAPMVFSIVNFADKYVIERQVRDTRAMPIYAAIMSLLTGFVLFGITGFPILPLKDTVLVLAAGAMTSVGAALYFKAMGRDEASKIIVLLQMQPVIVLLLSLVFLNETISGQQLLGFVLILGAAVAISLNRVSGGFRLSETFFLILLGDLILAASVVLFKSVTSSHALGEMLPYESWGFALGGSGLYLFVPSIRNAFNQNIRVVSRRTVGIVALSECIYVVAKLLALTAVSLGPVALVSVVGGSQVFFGVVLGAILTTLAPAIFKEDISRANLARKAVLAIVLFGGIVLVN